MPTRVIDSLAEGKVNGCMSRAKRTYLDLPDSYGSRLAASGWVKPKLLVCAALLASRAARADEGVRIGVVPGAILSLANANTGTGYGGDLWGGLQSCAAGASSTPHSATSGSTRFHVHPLVSKLVARDAELQAQLSPGRVDPRRNGGRWLRALVDAEHDADDPRPTTSAYRSAPRLALRFTDQIAIGIEFQYKPLLSLSAPSVQARSSVSA